MNYDIYINAEIGYPFSAEYIRGELDRIGDAPCRVFISSLGGSAVDALQIRQMFLEHGNVTVYLHGFVASAATIIAMGAKHIAMGRYALLLVHRCANAVDEWGTMNSGEIASVIEKLRASQTALETIDQTVANIYAARCGSTVEDAARLMKEAEWLTAERCLEIGLVDEVTKDDERPLLTDAMRGTIAACALPLPTVKERAERADTLYNKVCTALRPFFARSPQPVEETPTETKTDIRMNLNDFTTLRSVLAIGDEATLATQDGKAVLNAEQMKALDARLSALIAENEQIATLQARIDALEKADGDETAHIEAGASAEDTAFAARVRADYNLLKHLG